MTKSELEILRLRARVDAQEMALGLIVRSLSRDSSQRTSLRRCIAEITLPVHDRAALGTDPNYSMLLADETRDAFDALSKVLMKKTER